MDLLKNPSSSFYLHLGENSRMILVSPPLNDTNYHSWSRRALLFKNKLKFINGEITGPKNTGMLTAKPSYTPYEEVKAYFFNKTLLPMNQICI